MLGLTAQGVAEGVEIEAPGPARAIAPLATSVTLGTRTQGPPDVRWHTPLSEVSFHLGAAELVTERDAAGEPIVDRQVRHRWRDVRSHPGDEGVERVLAGIEIEHLSMQWTRCIGTALSAAPLGPPWAERRGR